MHRRQLLAQLATVATTAILPRLAKAEGWIERMAPAMGSFTQIAVATQDVSAGHGILTACFGYMQQAADEISNYSATSATTRLNAAGVLARSAASTDFWRLVDTGLAIRAASGGFFDPFMHPLLKLWRSAAEANSAPEQNQIDSALADLRRFQLVSSPTEVQIKGGGFEVGGMGKGYVADLGVRFLKRAGVSTGRIACGGDLRFFGAGPWTVNVRHPRRDGILRTIEVPGDCAVSTSGDYESCWDVAGTRHHHLIDPTTGYPTRHTQQVTVVAATGAHADAAASALFIMPASHRQAFVRTQLFSRALIVDAGGDVEELMGSPT